MTVLSLDFMRLALVSAVLVGLVAPAVGVFLVQRRLALMGDGIGHIALTGVALGFLLGTAPVLTAVVVATIGAVVIELVRQQGRTSGDVALALMFYGGIAGGVLLIGLSEDGSNASLLSYLFGSLTAVAPQDVVVIAVLAGALLLALAVFGRQLFAVCHDEEHARVMGLQVRALNLMLAVMAALTVTVSAAMTASSRLSARTGRPMTFANSSSWHTANSWRPTTASASSSPPASTAMTTASPGETAMSEPNRYDSRLALLPPSDREISRTPPAIPP